MKHPRTIGLVLLGSCAAIAACATGTEHDLDDDDDGTNTTSQTSSSGTDTAAGSGSGSTATGSAQGGAGQGGAGQGGTGATGGTGGSGGTAGTGGTGGSISPGDLVINEIMNNPSVVADDLGEWFEVFNDSTATIDLHGLAIRHQATAIDPNALHTISSSVTIAPGDYAVLGLNANTSTNGNVTIDYPYPGSVNLNNTSDYLAIETSSQLVIDETSWDQTSGFDPDGSSRSLDPAFRSAATNDDDSNFCAASSFVTGSSGDLGTPGSGNDSCP